MEGEVPDFVITVTGKPGGKGGPTTYEISQTGKYKPISQNIINGINKLNPNAQNEEQMTLLHDLNKLCQPSYLSAELQEEIFGEIIDDVPMYDNRASNVDKSADETSVETETDKTPDNDMEKIFGATVHKNEDEEKPETPAKEENVGEDGEVSTAKPSLKW